MKVLFNASVILAGINSPNGASGVLLDKAKKGELEGIISELIFNEAVRHGDKVGLSQVKIGEMILNIFTNPVRPPYIENVEKYYGVVIDEGDAHVLATCDEEDCDVLVTLDKKHLLILKGLVSGREILSSGELLRKLRS